MNSLILHLAKLTMEVTIWIEVQPLQKISMTEEEIFEGWVKSFIETHEKVFLAVQGDTLH